MRDILEKALSIPPRKIIATLVAILIFAIFLAVLLLLLLFLLEWMSSGPAGTNQTMLVGGGFAIIATSFYLTKYIIKIFFRIPSEEASDSAKFAMATLIVLFIIFFGVLN